MRKSSVKFRNFRKLGTLFLSILPILNADDKKEEAMAYITYTDHLKIEEGLTKHLTFGQISLAINKNLTTVAREVKKYATIAKTGYSGFPYNACTHPKKCEKKHVSPDECKKQSAKYCRLKMNIFYIPTFEWQ
jgi:IS30 family transposase